MTVANWIQEAYANKSWLMTRGGDKCRVICVDAPGAWSVISISAEGHLWHHATAGQSCIGSSHDLLPPKRSWDVCVVQFKDGFTDVILADHWGHYNPSNWTLLARATIEEGEGI